MLWGEDYDLTCFEAELQPSEARALSLLQKIIPSDLFNRYCHTGTLPAVGQITGNDYLIRRNETILQYDSLGKCCSSFCMVSSWEDKLPYTDRVVALWLIIHFNEDYFISVANKFKGYEQEEDLFDLPPHEGAVWRETPIRTIERRNFREDLFADLCDDIPITTPNMSETIVDWNEEYHYMVDTRPAIYETTPYTVDQTIDRTQELEQFSIVPLPTYIDDNLMILGLASYLLTPVSIMTIEMCYELSYRGRNLSYGDRQQNEFNVDQVELIATNGLKKVPLVNWKSDREIDDAVLHSILSAYVQNITIEHNFMAQAEFTKCLMSFETFQELFQTDYFDGTVKYRGMNILIDDRLDRLIMFLPDAANLGLLPHNGKMGIAVLNLQNILVVHSESTPLNEEYGIEMIYGGFPRGSDAIAYDIVAYGAQHSNCLPHRPREPGGAPQEPHHDSNELNFNDF